MKFVKFLIYARFCSVKWHFPFWEVPKTVMLKLLTPKSPKWGFGCSRIKIKLSNDNLIASVAEPPELSF